MRGPIPETPGGERRAAYSETLRGRQRAARARTTSRPGGRTAKAKKRARGRRVKARRIASYALEIREPYEFFPTMA
jgi:hypothetical protein